MNPATMKGCDRAKASETLRSPSKLERRMMMCSPVRRSIATLVAAIAPLACAREKPKPEGTMLWQHSHDSLVGAVPARDLAVVRTTGTGNPKTQLQGLDPLSG